MPLAPNTTKLGIKVFDQALGGIYLHKPTIVCGRRKSGKFVVATQLMAKTLLAGEKIVIFTAKTPEEIMSSISSGIVDLGVAAEIGQLVICPYSAMERPDMGPLDPLPFPQALDELSALVKENAITYAIFDTVVPWTAIQPVEAVQEHVDTFLSTLDSLGLTSLLLLPEPASPASHGLAKALREGCPINIELAAKHFGAEFTMQVTKYQGLHGAAGKLPLKFELDLTPTVGFDAMETKAAKRGIEAIALSAVATGAHGSEAAPAFRPFVAGQLVDFASPPPATPAATPAAQTAPFASFIAGKPVSSPVAPATPTATKAPQRASFAPFIAGKPTPMPAAPAAPATQTAQRASFTPFIASKPGFSPAAPAAPATKAAPAPSGDANGFSFSNVINLPEFPHHDAPAAGREPPAPPRQPAPPPETPEIQFSSVIR